MRVVAPLVPILLALLLGLSPPLARGQGLSDCPGFEPYVISKGVLGAVNWEGNFLLARGQGSPQPGVSDPGQRRVTARRAAEVVAYASAMQIVVGLNLNWERKVQGFLQQNPGATAQLQARIRQAQFLEERYDADRATVILKVPFFGITGLVVGFLSDARLVPPGAPGPLPAPGGQPEQSGLVVDARGQKLAAAILVQIVDEQGNPVYTPTQVDPAQLRERGTASYVHCKKGGNPGTVYQEGPGAPRGWLHVRPVAFAVEGEEIPSLRSLFAQVAPPGGPRAGRRPLTVKTAQGSGSLGVTVVVGRKDAELIRLAEAKSGFLKNGNVLVVVDPIAAGTEGRGPGFPTTLVAGSR